MSVQSSSTVQFGLQSFELYCCLGMGSVIGGPLVGVARIVLAIYQLRSLPDPQKLESLANSSHTNQTNLKAWKNYKSVDEIRTFWRSQCVRGLLEVVLPIIASLYFLLRDLLHARPTNGIRSESEETKNPFIETPYYTNIGSLDEIREARAWQRAIDVSIMQLNPRKAS